MSWVHSLYDTYERCMKIAGVGLENQNDALLPVGHIIMNTQVVVHLDINGEFLGAELQPEKIIAPCTEDSASRTSGVAPHPLFDSLQHLAGDYPQYVDDKFAKHYKAYINQLEKWCGMPNPNPMVLAILAYLNKGSLIEDLVAQKVLHLSPDGKLLDRWTEKQTSLFPAIKIVPPSRTVTRFTVDNSGRENRVWMADGVRESFMPFLSRQHQAGQALCYVSGLETACAVKHPKNITSSPNAKLMSANDYSGFTYRGRFQHSRQAVGVGYEVSQKAHNALRWLVKNRGVHCGSQVVITWATCGKKLPSPTADTDELFGPSEDIISDSDKLTAANTDTGHNYAQRFTSALLSIRCEKLEDHEDVSVMVLDNATRGRLSITYYRELKAGEYLERVAKWHQSCIWQHHYKKNISFIGAPSFQDITKAAYGTISDKDKKQRLLKSTVERLLPCVFDGARLPADLVNAAVSRASNPMAFDNQWEWNITLSTACALYNKQHVKEVYLVALEEQRHDRDYLYGRLLAVADWIEATVLRKQGDGEQKRATNAMRYMPAFAQRPFHIWPIIVQQIVPYEINMNPNIYKYYKDLMSEIMAQFQEGDFEKPGKLSGAYLLGYHCQRQRFFDQIKEAGIAKAATKEDEGNESN